MSHGEDCLRLRPTFRLGFSANFTIRSEMLFSETSWPLNGSPFCVIRYATSGRCPPHGNQFLSNPHIGNQDRTADKTRFRRTGLPSVMGSEAAEGTTLHRDVVQ